MWKSLFYCLVNFLYFWNFKYKDINVNNYIKLFYIVYNGYFKIYYVVILLIYRVKLFFKNFINFGSFWNVLENVIYLYIIY